MDVLKHYVELFNKNDEEVYKNEIDNSKAYEWLKDEIPLFECPDKDIEKTYYFRYWTYRKHLKKTDDGYVITEFLPQVPWGGKHNTINAATGHHIYEGRWLKNGERYLKDYISFFLDGKGSAHQYSAWLAYSALKLSEVTGDFNVSDDFLEKLCTYYETWEKEHLLTNGMFWSIDNHDAMEFSISGTTENFSVRRGIRPTLNSYMCADAYAISRFALLKGDKELSDKYLAKHLYLKEQINENLWANGFYRAYHYDNAPQDCNFKDIIQESVRELLGYIPWMFSIPPIERTSAFDLLFDDKCFFSEYGLTTADKSHPRYLYKASHECLWNGYVWPFATSQTLTALYNVIHNYSGGKKYVSEYYELLLQYAKSHTITLEDGRTIPWIDEVKSPCIDDWSSRTILRDGGWLDKKGGYERGKDYNHSTFCDLVISGLIGVKTDGDSLEVNPIIPEDWEWFRLSNLYYRGKKYEITYDKYGKKYGCTPGLTVKCL